MTDLLMTPTGDLVWGPDGDLVLVSGDAETAQEVQFRLQTYQGDWTLVPGIGCSLEDFIGAPNTPLTWAAIEQRIVNQLEAFSLLENPSVQCVDLDTNSVLILIEFNSLDGLGQVVQIQGTLDLNEGNIFSRSLVRQTSP